MHHDVRYALRFVRAVLGAAFRKLKSYGASMAGGVIVIIDAPTNSNASSSACIRWHGRSNRAREGKVSQKDKDNEIRYRYTQVQQR